MTLDENYLLKLFFFSLKKFSVLEHHLIIYFCFSDLRDKGFCKIKIFEKDPQRAIRFILWSTNGNSWFLLFLFLTEL